VTAVHIGISGWTYPGWRGSFYPPGLAHRRELSYASERLSSIEINGSFYSLQRPSSFQRWYDETPDDFIFSVTEPILAPIRRALPMAAGMDFSPLIALVLLQLVEQLLLRILPPAL